VTTSVGGVPTSGESPGSGSPRCRADSVPVSRSSPLERCRESPRDCCPPPEPGHCAVLLPPTRPNAGHRHLDRNAEHRCFFRSRGRWMARRLQLALGVLGQRPAVCRRHRAGRPLPARDAKPRRQPHRRHPGSALVRTEAAGRDLRADRPARSRARRPDDRQGASTAPRLWPRSW
jgi:hypothetical protein